MDDDQPIQPARKGGGIYILIWWVGIGLTVYVLSTGPVVRQCSQQGKATLPSWALTFYRPLIFLSDNVKPVENFLRWYVELWEPDHSK